MEYKVNPDTGEIFEEEDKNEIVERKLNEVGVIDQETFEMIEMFLYYEEQYELFRYKLEKAMNENGIKKWDNDLFTATIKEASMQKRVDVDRMKEDGIYDRYLKLVPNKGGLQIRLKGKYGR